MKLYPYKIWPMKHNNNNNNNNNKQVHKQTAFSSDRRSQKIYDLFLCFCTILAFLKIDILKLTWQVMGWNTWESSFWIIYQAQELASYGMYNFKTGLGCPKVRYSEQPTSIFFYLKLNSYPKI